MSAWPIVPVKDYARVVGGATPKSGTAEYWDGDIPWTTPKDLSDLDGKYLADTPRKITASGLKSCSSELLPPNSVLFSSRAPIGHVAINTVPMATNQGFKSFIPSPKLDASFLFWWLKCHRAQLELLGNGATFKEVSKAIVERIEIPLPPLDEQKRIAAILDQADELRRKRQRAIDRLNQLGQAIFHEMFGDPKTNPHGFPTIPLGELIKVSSGAGLIAAVQKGGDYPVYGGNGVNGWHDNFTVPAGTIVIGRVGVYCGAVHVTDRSAWVTDNALIVSLKRLVNPTYLATALKLANLNQYAGRSAQPLVSGNRIYPIEILDPPIDKQDLYESKIRQFDVLCDDYAEARRALNSLFSALQHRAFQGEL